MNCIERKEYEPVTVVIVGAGEVGRCHGEAFAELAPEARVIGIADIDQGRGRALAHDLGTCAFTDYRTLIELEPDLAVICLPHNLHREAGLAAAQAGVHVLMEKPLAHTLHDARAIVRGCQEYGVTLATGFVHRYRAEYQRAFELIQQGVIGEPAMVVDSFTFPGGEHVPGWVWEKEQAGGGILMYTGIHSIDRLRWLLDDEVDQVFGRTLSYSQKCGVEDGLLATLEFERGCLGSLIETQPSFLTTGWGWDTQLYGSRGCLSIRAGEYAELHVDGRVERIDTGCEDDHFVRQARDVVSALRDGGEPWITGRDGLHAMEIVDAIYHSAEKKTVVSLREFVVSR